MKWAYKFMARKQGGCVLPQCFPWSVRKRLVLIFRVRDLLLACPPVSFSYILFILFPIPVNPLYSGSDFGPCLSLWVTLFLSGISRPYAWQKCAPLDLHVIPVPSARLRLLSPLSWEQLIWAPKRTNMGVEKRRESASCSSSGNTPSLLVPPECQPRLHHSHSQKVSIENSSWNLSKEIWFATPPPHPVPSFSK